MRMGQANKIMARSQIQMQGMGFGHQAHDDALCEYAEACAQDMYEKLVQQLPAMIDKAVVSTMKHNPYEVTVDTASIQNVKKKIVDAIMSAFK